MIVLKMLIHIGLLFVLLYIGNWIQASLGLSVPGSVIGMLLLFLLLKLGIIKLDWIREGTNVVLKHLALFFIPVNVGFINYLGLFSGSGILLLIITVISTAFVMGFSGAISQWLAKGKETQHE